MLSRYTRAKRILYIRWQSRISCEQNGQGDLICPDDGQIMRPPRPGAPAPGAPGPRRLGPQASALVRPSIRHVLGGLLPQG